MVKLCLAIGVGDSSPLSILPGAVTAANEVGEWADRSGYGVTIVTDENGDTVTIPRLRDALD